MTRHCAVQETNLGKTNNDNFTLKAIFSTVITKEGFLHKLRESAIEILRINRFKYQLEDEKACKQKFKLDYSTYSIGTPAYMMSNIMPQHDMFSVERTVNKVFIRMILPALHQMVLKSPCFYSVSFVVRTNHQCIWIPARPILWSRPRHLWFLFC